MYGFKQACVRDLCMYLFVYAGLQAPLNVSDGDTTSLEYIVRVQSNQHAWIYETSSAITSSCTSWWRLYTMVARILSEASSHETRKRAHIKAMVCSTAILLCFFIVQQFLYNILSFFIYFLFKQQQPQQSKYYSAYQGMEQPLQFGLLKSNHFRPETQQQYEYTSKLSQTPCSQ